MEESIDLAIVHSNEVTAPADRITYQNSRDSDMTMFENSGPSEIGMKRKRIDIQIKSTIPTPTYALEERLHSILCCSVCLDIPYNSVFQVRISWFFLILYKFGIL